MLEKLVTRGFKSFRNFLDFLKVVILFTILLLLLYWIEDLTKASWGWLKPFEPFLSGLVNFGKIFSDGSIKLFAANFEFKFFISLFSLLVLYAIVQRIHMISEPLEKICDNGCDRLKEYNEQAFNKNLNSQIVKEQNKINSYKILVSTSLKPKFSHESLGVNIDEENKIMNKFIIEKTGINPTIYNGAFLYNFSNFNNIDSILQVFFKIVNSNSKLDYCVCVQVTTDDKQKNEEDLNKLNELQFKNKIYSTSETAYRYKFNKSHRYGTSKVGVFQKDNNETFEVDEFVEI